MSSSLIPLDERLPKFKLPETKADEEKQRRKRQRPDSVDELIATIGEEPRMKVTKINEKINERPGEFSDTVRHIVEECSLSALQEELGKLKEETYEDLVKKIDFINWATYLAINHDQLEKFRYLFYHPLAQKYLGPGREKIPLPWVLSNMPFAISHLASAIVQKCCREGAYRCLVLALEGRSSEVEDQLSAKEVRCALEDLLLRLHNEPGNFPTHHWICLAILGNDYRCRREGKYLLDGITEKVTELKKTLEKTKVEMQEKVERESYLYSFMKMFL